MGAIVLVHGIAQEQRGAEDIAAETVAALVSGIQNASQDMRSEERERLEALAQRIGKRDRDVEVTVAFYGSAFLQPRTDDVDVKRFKDELALAMMKRARDDSSRRRTQDIAARQLQEIEASGEAQGLGRMAGAIVERLGQIPGIADWVMDRAVGLIPALDQVGQYMREPNVREFTRNEVRRLMTPDTRVLIGHSLGSVVAYDIAREQTNPLPLLLTLGSPLGLKQIIYDRLDPQPPTFPAKVHRWVNVADREDYVASTLNLEPLFSPMPTGAIFDNVESVDNGNEPHALRRYLTKKVVGSAILQAMMPLV
ncbi:hypothetical protein ACETRX_32860 [Labrys portucalensis]|uniref:Alpha/beta hydrolase n=1 Tax=Labrys neptuniae TaxID=376174 RepID=A0ABV6ZQQ6_9HYPH